MVAGTNHIAVIFLQFVDKIKGINLKEDELFLFWDLKCLFISSDPHQVNKFKSSTRISAGDR